MTFESLKIHTVKNPDPREMSEMELKHFPVLEIKKCSEEENCYIIKVIVGKYIKHPMDPEHFIQWIELYINSSLAFRCELTPECTKPVFESIFELPKNAEIFAKAKCNKHGVWISRIIYMD